ncbi:NAD(P)/FAD-dependent oxidoreductase [Curvivirga sp.]|uniref:NAD(P)/FAD-dependent oxidoreductase n=1 Tax=Curvivirga sp. TaxID=2856848 RepID=UPI003B594AE3
MTASASLTHNVAIIGAGPAGLIAAQKLAEAGVKVVVYEAKPSVARKFLLAGRGGLNLTHSEDILSFLSRYAEGESWVKDWIAGFSPEDLRAWSQDLGVETFIGTSGRVFPEDFRAKGILRAWLQRLGQLGVELKTNQRWVGFTTDGVTMQEKEGDHYEIRPDAVLFALGGGSYAHMGADAKWIPIFQEQGVDVTPLQASNVGFNVPWSDFFKNSFQGQPLKNIALKIDGKRKPGEAMLTRYGIEGNAIYALSASLRDQVKRDGEMILKIDLKPSMNETHLLNKLKSGPGRKSLSSYLKSQLKLTSQAVALLREFTDSAELSEMPKLAEIIKNCPVKLTGLASMDKAISTAGGIKQSSVDKSLMLKACPGYFVAGEMLDWEAPTGGYLLQACFSSGVYAAKEIIRYLDQ